MKQFFQWLRKILLADRDKKYVYRLFNNLLKKYNIERDGSDYLSMGKHCSSEEEYNNKVTMVIKPMFANLRMEGIAHLEENGKASRTKTETYQRKAAEAKENLNESNPNGQLFKLQQEIERIKAVPDSTDTIDFPEITIEKINKPVFDPDQNNEKNEHENNQDELITLFKTKKQSIASDRKRKAFKLARQEQTGVVQSDQLPPREKKFKNLYNICKVILVGEIGITAPIVSRFVDVDFFKGRLGELVELALSCFYAVVISLSLAIGIKYIGDALLYRNQAKIIIFWVICIIIFLAMTILFSLGSADGTGNKMFWIFTITHRAFVLSFFSVLLALANSFVYREASYLEAYFYRQKKIALKAAEDEHDQYYNKWQQKANEYDEKTKEETAKEQKSQQLINEFNMLAGNQESISIQSYRDGFEQSLREAVRNNNEVMLAITKLLKQKL